MVENNNYTRPPYEEEEEGIDIIALVKSMWKGRKTIIISTAIFMALGLVAALTMKRTYTVKHGDRIKITMARNGGFAAVIQ